MSRKNKMTPPPPSVNSTKLSITDLTEDFGLMSTSSSSSMVTSAVASEASSLKYYARTRASTDAAASNSLSSSGSGSNLSSGAGSGSTNTMSVTRYSDDFTLGLRCSVGSITNTVSVSNISPSYPQQQKSAGVSSRRQSFPSNTHHHHHHLHTSHNRNNPVSSKERYVFSNFRFLVKEGGVSPKSVDEAVDWLSIEMVLVPDIEHVLCPICLDVPFVPRFTRCGHIYCLPCLLQFFQTVDSSAVSGLGNNWRSCPVCAEALHLKQLRPIKFCPATEPKEGEIFNSVLVKKSIGSLQISSPSYRNDSLDSLSPFQRLIPVSRSFVQSQILNPDLTLIKNEISLKKRHGECTLELSFLESAQKMLQDQKRHLNSIETKPMDSLKPVNEDQSSQSYYYFHQSKDGLNVFLHPLCMKILKFHFESYEAIPEALSLPILQLERLIVTSANRRRFKYLDHLSSGTQIILVEVDLRSIVSSSTLLAHQKELTSRQDVRDQKSAAESRRPCKTDSILDEWKRMEDDYYFTTQASAAMDIKIPEGVNLNDLNDESSFPLPSSFNTNNNNCNSSNNFSTPQLSSSATFKRSPMLFSNCLSDSTGSPPSFSALAHSLNSPFNLNLNFSIDSNIGGGDDGSSNNNNNNNNNGITTNYNGITATTTAPNTVLSYANISETASPTSNTTTASSPTSGKKKFVLFSSGGLNIKR